MNCQRFSTGFNLRDFGGSGRRVMFCGILRPLARFDQTGQISRTDRIVAYISRDNLGGELDLDVVGQVLFHLKNSSTLIDDDAFQMARAMCFDKINQE